MKQIITESGFRDAFNQCGRGDQFSYEALGLIYDYLNEIDEDMELDVIAICCEFAEYTFDGVIEAYDIEVENDDDKKETVMTFLEDKTSVVGTTDNTVIFQQF